jgi:hypothetical protein
MIDTPIILENVIPLEKQEELKHIMFDTLFPWFYRGSLSSGCEDFFEKNYSVPPGFAHVFYNRNGKIGNFLDYIGPVIDSACSSINFKVKNLLYARSFLQMPLTTHSGLTIPHIDINNQEHLVLIYYVVDADGDTVLFNRKHDMVTNYQDPSPLLEKDIIFRMTPKQGSVLAFNGSQYHANILPKNSMRCIVNLNLEELT